MAAIKYYFSGKKKRKTRKAKTIALKNINKNGRKNNKRVVLPVQVSHWVCWHQCY
jgi:hypothetical protein